MTAQQFLNRSLAAYFYGMAALYAITTLVAITKFGWPQPMFDQWRMYPLFLDLPFPQNVVQLENGHRPIFPNLIRVAEIRWLSANQMLQLSLGTICALGTAAIVSTCILRQHEWRGIYKSIGVMLAVLGVLWLGNARMLLHGHESLHAYLLMLSVMCAGLCMFEAKRSGSPGWLGLANLACVVATFCFGPGISSFVGILVLGIVLRVPWRWLLLSAAVLTACLAVYLLVLPGNEGVRASLEFSPLQSVLLAAQWLSAPWVDGWLGSADPHASWVFISSKTWLGYALTESANVVVHATGFDWGALSAGLGVLGIVYLLYKLSIFFWRKQELTRIQALALSSGTFVLAISLTMGVTRLHALREHADQIYADRYLLWSSLFWCSLSLLWLCDIAQSKRIASIRSRAACALFILLPIALLATQRSGAVWGSMVYRSAQTMAAAVRSGVFPDDVLIDDTASSRNDKLKALNSFRERRLAMFSEPTWERIGSRWNDNLESTNSTAKAAVHLEESATDLYSGAYARHFDGCTTDAFTAGQLTVLDKDNVIVGFAEYSYIEPQRGTLASVMASKNCFDGYVKGYDSAVQYSLVALDFDHARGSFLALLPKEIQR